MTPTKKILIIDDEQSFGELLKLNLESVRDHHVTYVGLLATSGAAGLQMVQQHRPDLVLLDMMMPDMGGLEVLQRIKQLAPELPVAMVTAVWDEREGKRCFDAGAYEYITKPVDFDYLHTALLVRLFQ